MLLNKAVDRLLCSLKRNGSAGICPVLNDRSTSLETRSWTWLGWFAWLLVLALPFNAALADDPWAPFDMPWFDRLVVGDGLPHSVATAIAQDQSGVVWIGTMGGLVRYDGYRVFTFGAMTGPSSGLPDTYVRTLLTLPNGGLLVGTDAGGLSRFNPDNNRFYTYPISRGGSNDRKIYALAHDGEDGVWIATEHGLDRLDLHTNQIAPVATGSGELASRNFSVLEDHAGNIWLGNDHGLFVRAAGSIAFVRPPHPRGSIDTVLKDGIWAIYEDREGRLWVGSGKSGAAYRDHDGNWHEVNGYSGYEPNHEQRSTVRDFLEPAPDTIWMATDGIGVMVYTPTSGHLRRLVHDAALPSTLPGDSIRALMQDRVGNVWVASDLGVAHTQPNAHSVFTLLPAIQSDHGLGGTNVRSIYVDSRGRIWLGMSAGRIDMIDLQRGRIQHLQLGGNQTYRDVQSFAETPDGSLWVGTRGLARISLDTLAVQDLVVHALDHEAIQHLLVDGMQLQIATYNGVYRYNTQTHALTHFNQMPNDPGSLASDTVRRIDRIDSTIWYLTGHGLSIATDITQTDNFTNLFHDPSDPASLPNNLVSSILIDPHGRLWVGTGGGAALLEPRRANEPYRFRTVGVAQGLSSNSISAMQSDSEGNLWVGLSNGVASIDVKTHAAHNLSSRDGLRISSYVDAAAARAPTGELLFGGMGGLTVVRPNWKPSSHTNAPLVVTYAVLNGTPIPFGQLPRADRALTLKPHNRSLQVDFALLDYQAASETNYSYRMEGLDDNWVNVPRGSLPSAMYANLPHGKYILHLRATTQGLQPRAVEASLQIVVASRWYEMLIAMISTGVLLLVVLLGMVQLRTFYRRRLTAHLQQHVDIRTRDLVDANERLDELASTDELTGVFNRRRLLEMAEGVRRLAGDGNACVVLLDLDRFKQVNDTFGHLAGDEVIRATCRTILRYSREDDVVGRYGGEELMVCLPDGSLEQGMAIAERMREALGAHPVYYEGRAIRVTASIGVAAWREKETLSQWISRADGALYEAKRSGRNRCVAAS